MERAGRGGPVAHRRGVRAGLDPVHGADARGDRHRRRGLELGRARSVPAGGLLRRPRRAVPAHRARVRHATSALAVVKRHYPVVIGVGGAVLIAMGVLIWTGEFTQLNVTVNHWLQSLGLPNLNSDT